MLNVTPLSKPVAGETAFVGEVKDVDLREAMSESRFREVQAAWATYPVLVFRGQDLTTENHQAFAERFGKLMVRARPPAERGTNAQHNPSLMLVTNIHDESGKPIGSQGSTFRFHTDGCFNEIPAMATLLYGIEIPKEGGETLFVSMYQIYRALSEKTRRRIVGRDGVNYYFLEYDRLSESAPTSEAILKKARHSVHPLVIAHPVTRQPVVFSNRHNTREIVGMDQTEADDLLEEIFQTVERPEFIYAHKWRPGDLVVWDNRATQHARADYSPNERRLLRRFAVLCTARPQAYVETAVGAQA